MAESNEQRKADLIDAATELEEALRKMDPARVRDSLSLNAERAAERLLHLLPASAIRSAVARRIL